MYVRVSSAWHYEFAEQNWNSIFKLFFQEKVDGIPGTTKYGSGIIRKCWIVMVILCDWNELEQQYCH